MATNNKRILQRLAVVFSDYAELLYNFRDDADYCKLVEEYENKLVKYIDYEK